jgi:GntR family transcriptional regulator, arabinose operon transcriptional repressor
MRALPKYIQVKQELLSWIHAGKYQADEQFPSEYEIVESFKVSRQTVRQALGELEKEGWLYKVQGKGTFVSSARQREVREYKSIGLLTTYMTDYIFPHIARGVEASLRDKGYSLLLSSTDNDKAKERESLGMLLNQPLAGLIIEPTKSANPNKNLDYYLNITNKDIPYVMINAGYVDVECPVLRVDDEQGAFLATEHLIHSGHRHIAGIFKDDDLQGLYRQKGFIKAHQTYKVKVDPAAIFRFETENKNEMVAKLVKYCVKSSEQRPTAIVCYNDSIALIIVEQLRQHKLRVPEDISLVGFDDAPLAVASEVKLTTIVHPKEQMGTDAAEMLMEMIAKPYQEVPDKTYAPELIIRESTRVI